MTRFADDFSLLLTAALSERDSERFAAWRAWRRSVDIDRLSWPSMQAIPLLNGQRFHEWLADDPAAGVLKGIVRRAWTEAQLRLAAAQDSVTVLEQAISGPVVLIGPAAVYLRNPNKAAIRPISEIRLLVARQSILEAAHALQEAGWQAGSGIPEREALDWDAYVPFSRNSVDLCLHWRVPFARAAHQLEQDFLAHHEACELNGMVFQVLKTEYALLAEVVGRTPSPAGDVIPWQVDAALILRQQIDWARFTELAATYDPSALGRLSELRELGVSVPALELPLVPRNPRMRVSDALRRFARRAGLFVERRLSRTNER